MTFYERVNELCKQYGKSITAVAVELGMSKSVPYNWKRGTAPQNATIQKVANYFGMTSAELLNYDGGVVIQNVQDNHGVIGKVHTASVQCAATAESDEEAPLSEMEQELIRLFRKMSVIQQAQLIVTINDDTKGDE